MNRPPAFQFYPGDWLSSTDIMLMTPAEEGAYHRLLCHCWMSEDCGIPDDDEQLAILSRLGGKWGKSSPKIRAKFEARDGRLFNRRLLEERLKQDDWRRKSSAGGKRAAATRAQAQVKGASRVVEECQQPNANSSVFSLQSSTTLSPDGESVSRATVQPIRPGEPDYHARYEALYGRHPIPGFKAEGQTRYLEIVASSVHPEQVAAAIDREHGEWCRFWAENPAEYRPGIGRYFEEGYYQRKPKARDSPDGAANRIARNLEGMEARRRAQAER